MYGFFGVLQHSVFIMQFIMFAKQKKYWYWLSFPVVPLILGIMFPQSLYYTSLMKPISQILSHLPQLYVTYVERSSEGVSLFTQHLNILGGLSGLYSMNKKNILTCFYSVSICTSKIIIYCFYLLE